MQSEAPPPAEPFVQTPYEVRCESCQTTFPVGTRRCVHCGSRLGRRPRPVGPRGPFMEGAYEAEEESEESGGSVIRAALWALSVGLAILGSMFRVCQGG